MVSEKTDFFVFDKPKKQVPNGKLWTSAKLSRSERNLIFHNPSR